MSTMGLYRKLPVTVEAIRFDGNNWDDIKNWVAERGGTTARFVGDDYPTVYNKAEFQWINVPDGHWVIRGVAGEFYPCDPDVFAATYESVLA